MSTAQYATFMNERKIPGLCPTSMSASGAAAPVRPGADAGPAELNLSQSDRLETIWPARRPTANATMTRPPWTAAPIAARRPTTTSRGDLRRCSPPPKPSDPRPPRPPDPADLELARSVFRADPLGHRGLNCANRSAAMRSGPVAGKYCLICVKPTPSDDRPQCPDSGASAGDRGQSVFTSIATRVGGVQAAPGPGPWPRPDEDRL